jgi:NhaP-type Na+/H+ or K+/H+ antiporter
MAMHARSKQRWLAGGFAIGFALGFLTKWLLSLLRSRGAKAPEEMALTVAMAYLAFYLANAPGIAL